MGRGGIGRRRDRQWGIAAGGGISRGSGRGRDR